MVALKTFNMSKYLLHNLKLCNNRELAEKDNSLIFSKANHSQVKRTEIKECHPSFGSTVRVAHSSHTHRTIAA